MKHFNMQQIIDYHNAGGCFGKCYECMFNVYDRPCTLEPYELMLRCEQLISASYTAKKGDLVRLTMKARKELLPYVELAEVAAKPFHVSHMGNYDKVYLIPLDKRKRNGACVPISDVYPDTKTRVKTMTAIMAGLQERGYTPKKDGTIHTFVPEMWCTCGKTPPMQFAYEPWMLEETTTTCCTDTK